DRERVDMSDAMAKGTLKMLKSSDQAVEQTLVAAEIIETEGAQGGPGAAPCLSAAGLAAAVENQAIMQRMLAAELRAEAAMLAQDNAIPQRYADAAVQHRPAAPSGSFLGPTIQTGLNSARRRSSGAARGSGPVLHRSGSHRRSHQCDRF